VKPLAHRLHPAILARRGRESGITGATRARTPRNLRFVDPARQALLTGEGRAVTYWAELAPDRPAVVSPHGDRSFAALDARADRLGRALRRRGLEPGAAVALVARNRPEFVEVWAASRRAGYRLTPVNWHLTADEIAYIVEDCEARALVVDVTVPPGPELAARFASLVDVVLTVGGSAAAGEPYDGVVEAEPAAPLDDPSPGTLMLYTSGTTGRPKGVRKQAVPPRVDNLAGYDGSSVHLCTGPLYHAAPLNISMLSPLSNGATVVLMDGWSGPETLRLVAAHRVTHTHMVPTMFHRLLALDRSAREEHDLSSLRLVVHGAAPCPVGVKQAMIEWLGPIVVEYYASTEGAATLVDSTTWLRKPGTVGRPPPDLVLVGDDDAHPRPTGEVGTIWIKSLPGEEFEYFGDPDKTARSQRGRWYTLGDLGYLDEDGYLFLAGRSAELIISGGVNIYPAEIDAVLLEHPAVRDVATIGVPNDEWGEEVLAVVEPAAPVEDPERLATELLAFVRARLAAFKCPRSVEFVGALPRQDNGKVYRRALRDEFAAGRGFPPG
jgi:long-chain acyl-CoA synthetase